MRLFCLHLEASYLQLSFFAYNCVVEICLFTALAFLLTIFVFFTSEAFCLQWESESNRHLNGL